eukprot:3110895-Pyramimonas_sp.AAC.1
MVMAVMMMVMVTRPSQSNFLSRPTRPPRRAVSPIRAPIRSFLRAPFAPPLLLELLASASPSSSPPSPSRSSSSPRPAAGHRKSGRRGEATEGRGQDA